MIPKKFYAGLVPVIAAVVFMAAPAMASAAEWFVNGKNEGATHVAVATYGHLKLHDLTLGATIACNAVDKGHVWNEGGTGHDDITLFNNADCVVEGTGGAVTCTVVISNLPYQSELVPNAAGVGDEITKENGEIEVEVKCPAISLEATYKGASLTPTIVNDTPSYAFFEGEPSGILFSNLGTEAVVEGNDYITGFNNETITAE